MSDERIIAIVYAEDGSEYDRTFNWETGQSYAQQGYKVTAIADDGSMTVAKAQALYNYERACYRDCFGLEPDNDDDRDAAEEARQAETRD